MTDIRIDVIDAQSDLEGIQQAWGELLNRVPGYQYIQTFDWCYLCWILYAKPAGQSLRIITLWQVDRLVGVWPLRLSHVLFAKILSPLGCGHGDTAHPLIEPGVDSLETARRLRQTLDRLADAADLPLLPSGSPLAKILCDGGAGANCHASDIIVVDPHVAPSWTEFLGRYSANMRRSLRSDRRRLEALGDLVFECVSDLASQTEAIAWTFIQKRDWLERHGLRERWYEGDTSVRFLTALAAYRDEKGGLEVFTLKLNGQIIASRLCTREACSMAGLAMTFDPRFGRFSPGMLISHDVLEWCFARGLTFNMGIAGNELKGRWRTGDARYQSSSVILTRQGRLYKWLLALKTSLGRAVRGVPGRK